jgi:hypothetical protein
MLFNKLFDQLRKRGYEIKELSKTHYRVEAVLDLYPVRCRWHNIATGKRGDWIHLRREPDMVKFIDQQVALADAILDKAIADGKFVDEPEKKKLADTYVCNPISGQRRFLKPGDGPWWARESR